MKITLKTPIEYSGQKIAEIELNLEGLTGRDYRMASQEASARSGGEVTPVQAINPAFQISIAARAAKLPVDFFDLLPLREFTKIAMVVQHFLAEPVLEANQLVGV